MKRSEITEETIYVWNCPKCETFIEDREDPDYEESVYCEHCNESFNLEDD